MKAGTSTPTRETPLCLTAATPSKAQVPDLCTDKEPCTQTKEIHDVPQQEAAGCTMKAKNEKKKKKDEINDFFPFACRIKSGQIKIGGAQSC